MKTLKNRLIGFAALVTVVAIVVGSPLLLLTFRPFEGITVDGLVHVLTHPDDGTVALAVVAMAGWIAWAYFTLAVVLEVVALLRHRPAAQLPGFSVPQRLARRLVAAAAMLFLAAPMAAGVAHASPASGPAAPGPAATATVQSSTQAPSTRAAKPVKQQAPVTSHVVRPGDSLRGLAQQYLGDADRWDEIFDASRSTLQPDGHRLSDPNVIVDGWTLTIPTTTKPAAKPTLEQQAPVTSHVVRPGDSLRGLAQQYLGDADRWDEIFDASRSTLQPDGHRLSDPNVIVDGWTLTIPTTTEPAAKPTPVTATHQQPTPRSLPQTESSAKVDAPGVAPNPSATGAPGAAAKAAPTQHAVPTPRTSATVVPAPPMPATGNQAGEGIIVSTAAERDAQTTSDTQVTSADEAWPVRTSAGVGAVVAAGVIALIASRRARQQRRRPRGGEIVMPAEQTMAVENQLRAIADPLAVEDVDCALRQLAATRIAEQKPLPSIRAARLTGDQFDLYLDEPAALPEPWYGTPDQTVWSFDAADRPISPRRLRETVPAPYPCLVTLGHDLEDGHVFVDLENLGALAIQADGPNADENARAVMAALAIELATSHWADDLLVSVVGSFADLEDALQTGNIRYVPTVTSLIDQLERRAVEDQQQLVAHTGGVGLAQARVTGVASDAWAPEIVLLCQDITTEEHDRLTAVLATIPHVAIAVVSAREPQLGEWSLHIPSSGPNDATLEPLGLSLRAQQITARDYSAILDSVATATYDIPTEVIPVLPTMATVTALPERSPFARPAGEVELGDAFGVRAASPAVSVVAPAPAAPEDEDTAPEIPIEADTAPEAPIEADTAPEAPIEGDVDGEVLSIAEYAKLRPVEEITTADGQPWSHPLVRVLGPVRIDGAAGPLTEPSKLRVLTEYATFLAFNPGTSIEALDDAIWPARKNADNSKTRNPATTRLRKWLGVNPETGDNYFPRYTYELRNVTTDWDIFQQLVPGTPAEASTQNLTKALSLVRGRPFEGTAGERTQARKSSQYRYAWAEAKRQEIVAKIVDAAEELALRNLHQRRWGACEEAVALGIRMNPGVERLWRVRILAAHQSRNQQAADEAIERLYVVVEDDLGSDLEPETVAFLEALQGQSEPFEKLEALL